MNLKIIISLTIVALLSTCSKSTGEPEPIPLISLQPQSLTISPNESGILSLKIAGFEFAIFGMSLQITFDSSVVSFSDGSGFIPGDFFGSSPIVLTEIEGSTIHLALSLIQGQAELSGPGSLGDLIFRGKALGSSTIHIEASQVHFFDSSGEEVIIPDLELESATIRVQ